MSKHIAALALLASVFALFSDSYAQAPAPYTPKPVPSISFYDETGKEHSLTDYKGQVLLVNFWATWCLPCVKEMPDLDMLQEKYGPRGFKVLALSQDQKGMEAIKKFYNDNGIKHLDAFHDPKGKAYFSLDIRGLPATFLVDHNGMEAARITGLVDWHDAGIELIFEDLLSRKATSEMPQ